MDISFYDVPGLILFFKGSVIYSFLLLSLSLLYCSLFFYSTGKKFTSISELARLYSQVGSLVTFFLHFVMAHDQ